MDGLAAFFWADHFLGGLLAESYSIGYIENELQKSRLCAAAPTISFCGFLTVSMLFWSTRANALLFIIVWS